MRRSDDLPLDPEVAAGLEAIDATLAADPVPVEHAELAELVQLLVADRPRPSGEFASRLDERVQRRFASPQAAKRGRGRGRWWLWTPAAGLAAALASAIVIVLTGGSTRGISYNTATTAASAPSTPAHTVGQSPARGASAGALSASAQAAPTSAVLEPPPNGRKVIQGGQLSLTTESVHIDDVAQEIFVAVGQVRGIVNSSDVTATGGPGGSAQFQLSIPSGSLPQTMAALSSLRYARVASRTDTTQDVNDQYQTDVQRLADERALRASLLKQLANATTQGQIDSFTTQLHDAEAAISNDQATLRSLNQQIAYSQVTVYINGGIVTPVHGQAGGGGFTFGKAAHDAGRVLTVAAGVALIALAALVPLALVAALGGWIAGAVRRRRREHALDMV